MLFVLCCDFSVNMENTFEVNESVSEAEFGDDVIGRNKMPG